MDDGAQRQAKALARYQVISAYIAMDPHRGQRRHLLEQLARKSWPGVDGQPLQVSAETIRSWVRLYRRQGLGGLEDKPHPSRGSKALSMEQVELACKLKEEVPERSLDRLITIMEGMALVDKDVVRRSTLHRALKARGLSALRCRVPDSQDLDRFEAQHSNDLWQSDMLVGPWLPDPERAGKMRRAYLYAFLDDHSRLLLHGRFSFKGDLPALELVFRRCLQKYGQPARVYYDNGMVYRSGHMRQIVATLGIHGITFTRSYRPMGHGKIEAFNAYCRSAFLAELKASKLKTLDELNEAFLAWADLSYAQKVHTETGEEPLQRWRKDIERVRYADEERLRLAFQWSESRSPDKAGLFSLFGTRYQVGASLAKKRIEVRYDPEQLDEVEVWHGGAFKERVRPFEVRAHRRPKPRQEESPELTPASTSTTTAKPAADWLGHLVSRRRELSFIEPSPRELVQRALRRRAEQDQAIVDLLAQHLDGAAFDEDAAREHLRRYGPFDPDRARAVLEASLAAGESKDLHVTHYLDTIRQQLGGAS
ncbi:MAG: DDE-type integrase/transposase/recombinase [Gammaproteobacteria bacterium]|nr:DDE-type integrase/transposase/recombinase [Gammaproteobacteria bacterium]